LRSSRWGGSVDQRAGDRIVVINNPLGLSPPIEFSRRARLFDVDPVARHYAEPATIVRLGPSQCAFLGREPCNKA